MTYANRLTTVDSVRQFALAGNATLTLLSLANGTRSTYKIRRPKKDGPFFVGLLRGSDNENDFDFMGSIHGAVAGSVGLYFHGNKSKIRPYAQGAYAFTWFWFHLRENKISDSIEVWHEGRCGRCGRKLTVPSSIEHGIGPECARAVGFVEPTQPPLPKFLQRQAD